ncbi:MAG: gfo/Idh/MocA family oxidoreductase, partial [Verrucomicrobiota bacterium]|nr:gfo/Idh/MocA family oxidoreductase [Verrucomicrobiota bacterium]
MKLQAKPNPLSRRSFIRGTALSSAVFGFPAITQSKSPNGKLAVGLIGVGGRGRSHVAACRNEQVVSLCDVNQKALDGAIRFPWCKDARTYADFRDFYEKIDDIDAVVVSTTEH